jgi:hypothetical protein
LFIKYLKMERISYRVNNLSAIDRNEYIKTSQDFFTRRNNINMLKSTNLSPIKKSDYSNIVNILKTDIIMLDNLIKRLSDILHYHIIDPNKADSFTNIAFQKKCKELQLLNNSTNSSLNKISENGKNLDYLFNMFKCINKDELIYKIALEYFLDEFVLEKLNNSAFLINLRHFNDGNNFLNSYRENYSKLDNLKFLLETLGKNNLTQSIDSLSINNESEHDFSKLESDFSKILEMKNLSELFEYKTEDGLIIHIKELVMKFYDKIFYIFDDLNKSHNQKSFKSDDLLGNFFFLRENFEKIILLQNSEILKLTKRNEELQNDLNSQIKKNDLLVNEIINKLEKQNETMTNYLNTANSERLNFLTDEINKLTHQLNRSKDNIYILNEEIKTLQKNKKQNLNDSYDKLMAEQFDNMKSSFVGKIQKLTDELTFCKIDSKQKLIKVENELAVVKQMKDLFMGQIVNLKRII